MRWRGIYPQIEDILKRIAWDDEGDISLRCLGRKDAVVREKAEQSVLSCVDAAIILLLMWAALVKREGSSFLGARFLFV